MSDIFYTNTADDEFSQCGQRIECSSSPPPRKKIQSTLKITNEEKIRFEKKPKKVVAQLIDSSQDEAEMDDNKHIVEVSDYDEEDLDHPLVEILIAMKNQ